jgi:hypothetical protein
MSVWTDEPLPRLFPKWVKARYPSAVGELQKIDDGSSRFWLFAWRCIETAEIARAWRRASENDYLEPNEAQRRLDVEYAESLCAVANAARRIADHIRRYPTKAASALAIAMLRLKDDDGCVPVITLTSEPEGVNPFGFGPKTLPDVIERMLRHYADALRTSPLSKTGPFIHRFQTGALLYADPIDTKSARPDPVFTSLLFGLALLTRRFTAKEDGPSPSGCALPANGKVLWPLVVAFLKDTFGQSLSSKTIQDRFRQLLKRNPDVKWMGWPPPPPEYQDTPPRDAWA